MNYKYLNLAIIMFLIFQYKKKFKSLRTPQELPPRLAKL